MFQSLYLCNPISQTFDILSYNFCYINKSKFEISKVYRLKRYRDQKIRFSGKDPIPQIGQFKIYCFLFMSLICAIDNMAICPFQNLFRYKNVNNLFLILMKNREGSGISKRHLDAIKNIQTIYIQGDPNKMRL